MRFALAPSAVQEDYRLEVFETIDSTNAVALDRGRQGDRGRLWIVSPHQQAGRGRRGRPWQAQPGNLAATLLLKPDVEIGTAASLGFVAGLALVDALAAVVPSRRLTVGIDGGSAGSRTRFELKWPNDALANGCKLSGILLETCVLGPSDYAVAIGIGVNVVSHPTDLPYPATSLAALGAEVDAAQLFLALSDAWIDNVRLWSSGRGLPRVRDRWLERAAGLGSEVAVRVDGRVARGIFETIDEDGRFVIRADDGSVTAIAAGDVHFGAVASA